MKTKLHSLFIVLALLAGVLQVAAQGTAFTYQGRLNTTNGPANGTYDLTYKLWNAATLGAQVDSTFTITGTVISNGLFTATLDFGSVFSGSSFWLELAVRTNGVGSYQTLSPRQPLTPTPYAITAENVDGLVPASQLSGTVPASALSGTYGNTLTLNNAGNIFDGNGAGLTGVNASLLNGHNANFFWQLTGNAGTTAGLNFVGTSDNQPLEIHVNGQRALRVEPDSSGNTTPNVIGGSANSVVNTIFGATIGGGGGSLGPNSVTNDFGTIAGGVGNLSGNQAAVGGGYINTAGALNATVGGGYDNSATGEGSTIPGGYENVAAGFTSFAAGDLATANNSGSFVWSDNSGFSTADTGANQFVVRATGGAFFYDGASGVVIDSSGSNFGTINFGLRFGMSSGEGVASQRTAGPNQYDLNFYTAFVDRMTILNNGFVGINTTNPMAQLHIIKGTGNGASDTYDGGPALIADVTSGDGLYVNDTDADGFAVWAIATSGIGVNASATTGTGVIASSSSGTGLSASSSTGTGVYASSGTGSALTIGSGGFQVQGAGKATPTASFIVVSATTNRPYSNAVRIDNPLCDGNANAILLVTHNVTAQVLPFTYNNHPTGVWYDGANWEILNEDVANMPTNIAFNVLIINP